MKSIESSIWTTLYETESPWYPCYHVKWGHRFGPKLQRRTIVLLSRKFLRKHRHGSDKIPPLQCISSIHPLSPGVLGY